MCMLYGWYVCSIHTQSCAWHTMSSKRSPPTVNESTPEAAAAPTVDLHGVLVIESKRKKSTEWCGFAYGIIDDRNDLNFDGCRAANIRTLVRGGALPGVSGLWSPPLFEDLQSKWANLDLEQNEKNLIIDDSPSFEILPRTLSTVSSSYKWRGSHLYRRLDERAK